MTAFGPINRIRHKIAEFKISKLEKELNVSENFESGRGKYWLNCSATNGGVSIMIMTGSFSGLIPGYFVSSPNVLESLIGITFEDKINKTYRKAQKRCAEMNHTESYATRSLIVRDANND